MCLLFLGAGVYIDLRCSSGRVGRVWLRDIAACAVVRPAKLWCDTSTTAECAGITEAVGGQKAVIRALGNAVLPGFTAPKILWLRRHEPENYARLATVLLPHDYLNHWLTGGVFMEYGDASGTALKDVRKRRWS